MGIANPQLNASAFGNADEREDKCSACLFYFRPSFFEFFYKPCTHF